LLLGPVVTLVMVCALRTRRLQLERRDDPGQRGLLELQLVAPVTESPTDWLSDTLLVAADAFQSTPFKHAWLNKRRSPLRFRMSEWRSRSERRLRHGSAPRCLPHGP
jgi:Predicted metal-binding integral membrane protein (DUF2182)